MKNKGIYRLSKHMLQFSCLVQIHLLQTMLAKFLSAEPTVAVAKQAASAISKRTKNLAQVYSTLQFLQSCVSSCEVLADELGSETYTHPLHEHINECIVACEQLTGAMVRQSRFSIQYAEVCIAACANLADECVHAEAVTALQCASLCGDAVDLIREDFAVVLSN
jgi:hypothetical protein